MIKVAVTGATGFIGTHILGSLAQLPVSLCILSRDGQQRFTGEENFRAIDFDLENFPEDIFFQAGEPDVLIHLAWGGLPNYRSAHHLEREGPQQYRFLETMITSGLKTLFVAGTCFEYGMQSGELSELTEVKPDNCYALAKNTLHQKLEALNSSKSFNLIWGRLFYLYGEGQAMSSLKPQLERAVNSGEPRFNMSGGEQIRDFLEVREAAQYIVNLSLMERDIGVVNICSGQPISVKNIVQKWIHENDWPIEMNLGYYPYADFEPMEFWGNQEKLRSLLL